MKSHALRLLLLLLAICLSACGESPQGSGTGGEADTTVASIKISPSGLMFTDMGESQSLSATAYNAAGKALDVTDFTWETSKPDSVSVDAGGTATSQTSLGSATITAHAAGVTSTPLLISIAQPVPGAVLINDSQVIGDIRPHDTTEPLTLDSLYDVTLTGITPPEVGEILISTGEATVGGRVVEVREENGQTIVTLEFVSLDELFTAFTLNETLPMPAGAIEINPDLIATYDITHNPDSSLSFIPKPDLSVTGAVTGTSVRSMGPFECGTDLSVFPLGLSTAPTFNLTRVFNYVIIWEDDHKKLAVTGTLTVERTDSWALTSSLTGKITCEIEIASLPLPIPAGVAALFFSGRVPVGLGMEASGQLSLTGLAFEMKAKTGGEVEAGLEAPNGDDWQILSDYTQTDNSFESKWTPPPSGIASGLRLTPTLSGYAFANIDFGLRLPRSPRWQVVAGKLGLNMTGNLALVDGQIEDTSYASDYKLTLDASIGPGSGITNFLNRLRMNFSGAGMTLSVPLFQSPKATDITADVESFLAGDTVEFEVELDPASIDYLFTYNVFEVQIYRRKTDPFGDVVGEFIGAATAVSDQTDFTIPWTASYDGDINDEFYAYVVTRFLPFPYFESLELGTAIPTPPPTLSMEANLPATIASNGSATLDIIAGERQASSLIQGIEDLDITLQLTGGSASVIRGRTDANGRFSTLITPAADTNRVEVQIEVEDSRQTTSITETISARVICYGPDCGCPNQNCCPEPSGTSTVPEINMNAYINPEYVWDGDYVQCNTLSTSLSNNYGSLSVIQSFGYASAKASMDGTAVGMQSATSGSWSDYITITPSDQSLLETPGYLTGKIKVVFSGSAEAYDDTENTIRAHIRVYGLGTESFDGDYQVLSDITSNNSISGTAPGTYEYDVKVGFTFGKPSRLRIATDAAASFWGSGNNLVSGRAEAEVSTEWLGMTGIFTADGTPVTNYSICSCSGTSY